MAAVISIRELVVQYDGRIVVDHLNLSIDAGCIYALLGGNGAGKTTTINALLGFVRPAEGDIFLQGERLSPSAAAGQHLAYLPENVALYPYMTGLENLRYFCALAGVDASPEDAEAMLADTGLPAGVFKSRVSTYSKGMRQKVGLAIAYARRAKAMLLDEPTSGLDPEAADDFARSLRAAGDAGMAVLMATHDLFNAKQVADRIGIMKAGRLIAEIDAHAVTHQQLADLYLAHARAPAA